MRNTANRKYALAELRATLVAERDRMSSKNPDTLKILAAPQNIAVEDQIPLLHEQFVALNRHSRDRSTVGLINAALERFEQGEYGICEDCEDEISIKRLRAIPWASRCVACQEQYEATLSEGNLNLSLTA